MTPQGNGHILFVIDVEYRRERHDLGCFERRKLNKMWAKINPH
jgi:hypothetical protein